MKKVLFVDPWGFGNEVTFTNGLCLSLQKLVDLSLVSSYVYEKPIEARFQTYSFFFLNDLKE